MMNHLSEHILGAIIRMVAVVLIFATAAIEQSYSAFALDKMIASSMESRTIRNICPATAVEIGRNRGTGVRGIAAFSWSRVAG